MANVAMRHEGTGLTLKQVAVLRAIDDHSAKYGYGISYAEIADALGLRSLNTVSSHVKALVRLGYITHTPGVQRSLQAVKR